MGVRTAKMCRRRPRAPEDTDVCEAEAGDMNASFRSTDSDSGAGMMSSININGDMSNGNISNISMSNANMSYLNESIGNMSVIDEGNSSNVSESNSSDSRRSKRTSKIKNSKTHSERSIVISPNQKLTRLLKGSKWHESSDYESYRESLAMVDSCRSDKKMERIVLAIRQHMNDKPISAQVHTLKFALGAYVWMKVGDPDLKDSFGDALTSYLEGLKDPRALDIQQLQSKFQDNHRPQQVLQEYFSQMVRSYDVVMSSNSDDFWVNALCLWSQCGGLFSSPLPLDHDFIGRCEKRLISLMGRDCVVTLDLFLHKDITSLHDNIMKSTNKNHYFFGMKEESVDFLSEITKPLTEYSGEPMDADSVSSEWKMVMETLKFIFPVWEYQLHCKVMERWAHQVSFRSCKTFRHYAPLVLAVNAEQKEFDSLSRALRSSWMDDVRECGGDLSPQDVIQLLGFPANGVLSGMFIANSVLEHMKRHMLPQMKSFGATIVFLNDFYRRCSFVQGLVISKLSSQMNEVLTAATEQFGWSAVVVESLNMAMSDDKNLINPKSFTEMVVSSMKNAIGADAFVTDPSVEVLVNISHAMESSNSLAKELGKAFTESMTASCSSLLIASSFFQTTLDHEEAETIQDLVKRMFLSSADSWRPKSFEAIFSESPESLELFFKSICDDRFEDEKEFAQIVTELMEIFEERFRNFNLDIVSLSDLLDTKSLIQSQSWGIICRFLPVKPMTEPSVKKKISRIHSLLESISASLSAPKEWEHSLQDLSEAYGRSPAADSSLGDLFEIFNVIIASSPGVQLSKDDLSFEFGRVPLSELVNFERDATQFRATYEDTLTLCDYFHSNESIIFSKVISESKDNVGTSSFESLRMSVTLAKDKILSIFGPASKTDTIFDAVEQFKSFEDVEREATVILGCTRLHLRKDDIDRVVSIMLVRWISRPLAGFVRFCHEYQFSAVDSPAFTELSKMLTRISHSSNMSLSSKSCFAICQRFVWLLSPRHIVVSSKVLSEVDYAKDVLLKFIPVLKILEFISLHNGVWALVCDMEWFGEGGIADFRNMHGKITQVLRDRGRRNHILDAMGPAIQLISTVGGMRSEEKPSDLLEKLMATRTVSDWNDGGGRDAIELVQRNISMVREWFGDGVHEMEDCFEDWVSFAVDSFELEFHGMVEDEEASVDASIKKKNSAEGFSLEWTGHVFVDDIDEHSAIQTKVKEAQNHHLIVDEATTTAEESTSSFDFFNDIAIVSPYHNLVAGNAFEPTVSEPNLSTKSAIIIQKWWRDNLGSATSSSKQPSR